MQIMNSETMRRFDSLNAHVRLLNVQTQKTRA